MTQTTQFTIGAKAMCSDGEGGTMTRVVIDPVAQTVTHLVVEPKHQHGASRLVPLRLVRTADEDLHLDCTVAQFEKLDRAEETHFVAGDGGYSPYGPGQTLAWPYYRGLGGVGMGMSVEAGPAGGGEVVTTDSVPSGDVSVYRGDPVHATDGEIGHVRGLVIDAADHQVTHVLLHEGHLFHRKDVAIPIGAVTRIGDTIQLTITKSRLKTSRRSTSTNAMRPHDLAHTGAGTAAPDGRLLAGRELSASRADLPVRQSAAEAPPRPERRETAGGRALGHHTRTELSSTCT